MYDYDLFVIGAGSGGVRAARMASGYGAKVAIAEDRYMGGTCVNVGCVPKKLYSYASHFHYDFEDSRGFGWTAESAKFDWATLRDNKIAEIKRLNGIYETVLDTAKVELKEGRATIEDAHTVSVNGAMFTAKYILIATGGWPFIPDFPGKEFALSSNEIFDLPTFPEDILIVGGGYIAVEFAGIFAGLGARTHLSYRGAMPLKGFDEDVRKRFFTEAGKHIDMMMETNVSKVEKQANGRYLVSFQDGATLETDCILYATGRIPNTQGLGLANAGVELEKNGTIKVDDSFKSSVDSIYALGDVVGRMALTPVALAEGMALAQSLFTSTPKTMNYQNIATAVFSHPNIGTVGLSEEQAVEQNLDISVFDSDFRHLKHTISGRDERTYMKIIVNNRNDKVIGMHMMGTDAGEIIQGFAAAMTCGITKAQLDATIGIHPTAAEEFVTMRSARS